MPLTKDDLNRLREEERKKSPANWIRVGYSTCGVAAGAKEVLEEIREEVRSRGLGIEVKKCGCMGLCSAEPLVEVSVEGMPRVYYGKVDKDVAHKIIEEHVCQKRLVEGHIYEL